MISTMTRLLYKRWKDYGDQLKKESCTIHAWRFGVIGGQESCTILCQSYKLYEFTISTLEYARMSHTEWFA